MGHGEDDDHYYIVTRLLDGIYPYIFSLKLFFFCLKQTQTHIGHQWWHGFDIIGCFEQSNGDEMRVGHGRGPRCDISGCFGQCKDDETRVGQGSRIG